MKGIHLIILFILLKFDGTICRATDSGAVQGDGSLANYFKTETANISQATLSDIHSLADWQTRKPELRRQAAEMLGLDPMPARTALNTIVTGKIERDDFTVEKIYFQSQPHLYITANLYLPKPLTKSVPAILYLCGHTAVVSNGISFGNKVAYQHHGIWFARNGYACLLVDTLQWGEILGHHQGTYSEGSWWWNSRGYTPAGVETWNAIRALDYLDSRPEIDHERIGLTGRSGGGAYSWFVAALDDRVKVIAPIAGITDLKNYVVDGAVDDHCDCMFFVNTYRWDYPQLAALCAPRPLLLGNSDADPLFPLDGVMRTHDALKRIYDLFGAATNFGLTINPGPHKDRQELQIPVFNWFNKYLKNEDPFITMAATKMFSARELKVLDKIPDDQINTTIQDSFVPQARTPEIPSTPEAWEQMKGAWMRGLSEKCFAAWPTKNALPQLRKLYSQEVSGIRYEAYEFSSQTNMPLRFYVMRKTDVTPRQIIIHIADETFTDPTANKDISSAILETTLIFGESKAAQFIKQIHDNNVAHILFIPRAIEPTAWPSDVKRQTELRRRFMLLGQTLDGMRVWDICCATRIFKTIDGFSGVPIELEATGDMAVNALYASLFEPDVRSLNFHHIPSSHREGPDFLNVLKILDIPEAAAIAAEHCEIHLKTAKPEGWDFLRAMISSHPINLQPVVIK